MSRSLLIFILFFFNDTPPTEIYTLSLHDALPISSTPYKASAVLAAIRAFIGGSQEDAFRQQYALAQPEALRAEYRSLTHAPIPNQPGRYWARAAGHDVILFVLEAAPAQCLDIEATPEGFPTLRRLRDTACVHLQPYSTYP